MRLEGVGMEELLKAEKEKTERLKAMAREHEQRLLGKTESKLEVSLGQKEGKHRDRSRSRDKKKGKKDKKAKKDKHDKKKKRDGVSKLYKI